MGKLHSKHAAVCKPRESPEGDSFAVNASLARKGLEDWMVKQKYSGGSGSSSGGSSSGLQGCQHRAACGLSSGRGRLCERRGCFAIVLLQGLPRGWFPSVL
ncbi:protein naked cuticle homolog 1-like isoform X2 [Phasianus colchicus]|uniref:protein naked cuticle homolog 1-like isoform X2 n=1 Tax=Phasianus colchicus TaxID=9054 RepID=UPI00129D47A3|nr:protein naked cuticle homolog 1-like isoform X2 [Phasianus colchicus]